MELTRLIETEQRNDLLVRQAAESAAALVRVAHDTVVQDDAAFNQELQELLRVTARENATRRTIRVAAINAAAEAEVARYESVSDAQVAAVAEILITALITERGWP